MPLHVSSISAHHQEAKIVLYSFWYHHTYRWPSGAQVDRGVLSEPVHGTATYRCDDTRDCIIQFCPPDDEHMCSKHVESWNKLIIKFSSSSWLILRNKCFIWVTMFQLGNNLSLPYVAVSCFINSDTEYYTFCVQFQQYLINARTSVKI